MTAAISALRALAQTHHEIAGKQRTTHQLPCNLKAANQAENVTRCVSGMSSTQTAALSATGNIPSGSKPLLLDHPLSPTVDSNAGAKSVFSHSPASATTSLQSSTASLRRTAQVNRESRGRKRSRRQLEEAQIPIPRVLHAPRSSTIDCHSPSPLTELGYKIANERPRTLVGDSTPCESLRHPRLSDASRTSRDNAENEPLDAGNAHERNQEEAAFHSFVSDPPNIREGLGNAICRFAGVAGKVWQNWSNSFRGFYAGGGKGYDMVTLSCTAEDPFLWEAAQGRQLSYPNYDLPATPGGFPQADFIPDYMSRDHFQTPTRAVKRSKRCSSVSNTWVMVKSSPSEVQSPSKLSQRKVPSSLGSPRRTTLRGRRQPLQALQSPYLGSTRSNSGHASVASRRSPGVVSSPTSVQVRRHAARLKRKETEEDACLRTLNMRLETMIRQGKEALHTKFEVEDYVGDNEARDNQDL